LPSAKFAAQNKIGFQIVYASGETIKAIVKDSAAKIIHQTRPPDFNNLSGIVRQIAAHGEILAQRFDKNVDFALIVEAETPPPPILKIVFDALAHLVRNAVSHAFDRNGKITIEAKDAPNGLVLKVSDDGKGLDAEKIRRAAIEKNLISNGDILSAKEITDLIFAPNFSTVERVSDVSGRGVGLDAVKALTENAGGEISVKSEAGAGTTFEIFLPVDFEKNRRDAETENDDD
ncbi:MAG TPA: ATP-binding protein, partial [Pyrinomonadaceae bacterium]